MYGFIYAITNPGYVRLGIELSGASDRVAIHYSLFSIFYFLFSIYYSRLTVSFNLFGPTVSE